MNLKYLPENDLMYIYFESNVPNTQTRTGHQGVFKFVAKTRTFVKPENIFQ